MDSSILMHDNLLEQYNLNFNFHPSNRERNLKELKQKINMLIRTKGARLGAEYNRANDDEEKEQDESKKAELRTRRESIDLRINELRAKHEEMMKSSNLYELICYYIKNACDEHIFAHKLRVEKKQEENIESAEEQIKLYEYVREQLSSPEDVKIYIEQILPFIGSFDMAKMNLSHLIEGKRNLSSSYRYKVSIHDRAQLLLDAQTENDAIKIFSFGVYQYKADMIDVLVPYDILGIVRRDSEGNVEAYSGIMALRKCKEVELNNLEPTGDGGKLSYDLNYRFLPSKGRSIVVKYTSPMIPADMIPFITNVVSTPVVLKNAMLHNKGFIGSIEHGSGSAKYGGYKLVYDDIDIEELIESLSVAMDTQGEINGIDTGIYGNDLSGVLLMAKCASLAAGYRMEYKEKEKTGITQGE